MRTSCKFAALLIAAGCAATPQSSSAPLVAPPSPTAEPEPAPPTPEVEPVDEPLKLALIPFELPPEIGPQMRASEFTDGKLLFQRAFAKY